MGKYKLRESAKKDLSNWFNRLDDELEFNEWVDMGISGDAIEPIPERIELRFGHVNFMDESSGTVYRDDLRPINKDQLDIMEQAINGELFTKEEMISFQGFGQIRRFTDGYKPDYNKWFNDWLKDKNK